MENSTNADETPVSPETLLSWQLAQVKAGIDEANKGEFATEERMRDLFTRFLL